MNHGPLVFLGVFASLVTSWFGMVFVPQMQVGQQKPVAAEVSGGLYPAAKPGVAQQGAEIYRQQGCYYCHSQQIRQSGARFDVVLLKVGENTNAVVEAIAKQSDKFGVKAVRKMIQVMPATVLSDVSLDQAERLFNDINAIEAPDENKQEATYKVVPLGPDFDRGWGKRRSVSADYLFERTVQLGEQRIGPDLTNVGLRSYDANWHMLHLYEPTLLVKESKMPRYRFLFETRPIGLHPSPDALKLPEGTVAAGMEVVPKAAAKELVAYLLNLKAATPLFEAPMPAEPKKELPAATNAVATATTAK